MSQYLRALWGREKKPCKIIIYVAIILLSLPEAPQSRQGRELAHACLAPPPATPILNKT